MQKPMSYQSAKSLLDKIEQKEFVDNGVVFKIFITPALDSDFTEYCTKIRSPFLTLENETAMLFSSNGLFILRQIHIDGADVFYKTIEINP